jgi:uncharacterized protein YecT (DUF1311 family)
MRRVTPLAAVLAIAGLIIVALGIMLVRARGELSDGKSGHQVASVAQDKTQQRCASQRTYDRIKEELFRRAVMTRGSSRAPFDRLATYAVVRMDRPLLTDHDAELGTVRCSGRLSLDLPPGVAVVGGRRTLSADIDYVLQPAADGSGDVVMLEGADAIVVPLATLATTGSSPALQAPQIAEALPREGAESSVQPALPPAAMPPPPAPPVRPQGTPEPAPAARAIPSGGKPSFNCRYARTRGEIAVCGDSGLAALDRQMAAQFYRALSTADARQRQLLTRTRDAFLRYRDQCPSKQCIAQTYRERMREISDIAERR